MVTNASAVFPVAENTDMDTAAALPVNDLTAYHMLHTMAQVKKGDTIWLMQQPAEYGQLSSS